MKYKAQKEQKCRKLLAATHCVAGNYWQASPARTLSTKNKKKRYSLMRSLMDREKKSENRREEGTSDCEVGITRGEPRGGKHGERKREDQKLR